MYSSNNKTPFYLLFAMGVVVTCSVLSLPFVINVDGTNGTDWASFFGRFHIVVLHLPIGWLTLVPVLELIARTNKQHALHQAIGIIWYCAVISAVSAVILGITLASADGYVGDAVTQHMWFGISTCVVITLACLLQQSQKYLSWRLLRPTYYITLISAICVVSITGHLGGNLVQGEKYLTEKLPYQLQLKWGLAEEQIVLDEDSPIYTSFIHPILEKHCQGCHNEDKVKGQFRVDTVTHLFNGGKSHIPAIVPKEADKSELIRRVMLPPEDQDAMPPDGRSPLSISQLSLLSWWVEIGAPIEASMGQLTVNELPKDIERVLHALIKTSRQNMQPQKSYADIPENELLSSIANLKDEYGIDVLPISQHPEQGLQLISFNAHKPLDQQALESLAPLNEYIYSANFEKMQLLENTVNMLGQLSNLRTLNLKGASLPAQFMPNIASLSKLKVLNLYDTNLDDSAASTIASMTRLNRLYVAQTKLTLEGLNTIKASLDRVRIYHDIEGELPNE